MTPKQAVFIDPSYPDFLDDRLFDVSNPTLNRDGSLLPFVRLKESLQALGIPVHTADKLRDGSVRAELNHYWSLGLVDYQPLVDRQDVRLRGFVILEPSLVAPGLYTSLPQLTRDFERVYLHNTVGDGYSLFGVARHRLEKIYVPQPYGDVNESCWAQKDRQNRMVVIAGAHNPWRRKPEFYSSRLEAVAALGPHGAIDLYGRGWNRWWTRHTFTPAYWIRRRAIMAHYKGSCTSKMDVLSQYRFSLCFENTPMLGYVTEKIFDCFYAGTVPIYLGAPDISDLIPEDAYIDMRDFGSNDYRTMWEHVRAMSALEWARKREAGREFVRSAGKQQYYDSLLRVIRP
jgi:alpha(1,3/1,4) fucosyltransferase